MENMDGLSNQKSFLYSGKNSPVSPFSFFNNPASYPPSPSEPNPNLKSLDGMSYHQRCSSESFLPEEQPSWLDELLNETDTHIFREGHRRAASDSYAYLGDAVENFNIRDQEYNYEKIGTFPGNQMLYKDGAKTPSDPMVSGELLSNVAADHMREETSIKNIEGSAEKADNSQVKPSTGKTEGKRAKQQNAHRSRVRKLQYIGQLERTVQTMQIEGSEISAALEFLEQQNMILVMENRALRQRLETISQEQILKQWEQDMLEREIGRLQTMYHVQRQQPPHHQYPKHRRNKSKDHHDQINGCQTVNKETSSSKSSSNVSVQT